MKKLILIILLLILIPNAIIYAHPGRTDSDGGHYDHSTGEYHYHHGYEAHQHTNGKCPYDFVDKTNHNSNSDSSKTNSPQKETIFTNDIGVYVGFVFITLFFIWPFIMDFIITIKDRFKDMFSNLSKKQ